MLELLNISPITASLLVVLLPFVAFLIQAAFGRRSISGNIGLIAIILSTILSAICVFFVVWNGENATQRITWFTIGTKSFSVGILLNKLTVSMQLLVCIIALPVHFYSRAYMKGDDGLHRYWMYLSLFCFAMLGLTVSINLLQLYIFWELVGFASYLLIGFWFTRDAAVQANKKAFLINRIGDLGFLIGIALVYAQVGTLDLVELFGKSGWFLNDTTANITLQEINKDSAWLTFAGLAFFLGAMAKSAQFPLHVWLPDAMEGPTSVSSLIHAATMVAAGVFLLCTVFPLFNETVLLVIAIVGTITAFSAAIFALGQYDIKKILAFSTISQLGFMMVGVGIGAWDTAMLHLATHAFFKCLLFLCAGAVIHEMSHFKTHARLDFDPQDLRNMGGLRHYMPKTFVCMVIGALALSGFPLTSGYLSKDSIVVSAFEWASLHGNFYLAIPVTLIVVSLMTAFYIGRLIFKTFFGSFSFKQHTSTAHSLHEAPGMMIWPMLFLAACSLFPIFGLQPLTYQQTWLIQGFQVVLSYPVIHTAHLFIPVGLTIGAILAWVLGWQWYVKQKYPLHANNRWVRFSNRQGYLNEVNDVLFVKGTQRLSAALYAFDRYVVDGATKLVTWTMQQVAVVAYWFDKNIVDGIVNFSANTTYYIGHLARHVQNGQLQGYLGFALTVVILGILYLIIK
ncbi:NADH-quinone oxidoreductase subunit L [Sphingobacterium deserti]|uniref:Proton-translocating NADH-quinone oxidoreductase, chain L n=1 Tax=Sphingobacterium deserti TaxID=1229276 RepID=A0A0B8T7X0_9SPHI|nr:NADH-quinone oxidoreductase subunit L [Sphingobacterium deserti]KGE13925.1 proton-translocating NADH-quinone oxidoreductase, chain L [Sphingobacterium deserti]